jgi:hypothetical protein
VLSHISLADYYKVVFALAQHHKYSISDIENLMPYERDIYYNMIINYIAEQEQSRG